MVPFYPSGQSPLSKDKTVELRNRCQSGWFTVEVGDAVEPARTWPEQPHQRSLLWLT